MSEPIETKRCGACRSWLPVDQFGADASQPSGLAKSCRGCRADAHRRHRASSSLRSSRDHARRKAELWRTRFDALVSALAPDVLASLPADLRPTPHALRRARAAHRRATSGTSP
jgi:hypothetical protein